MNKNRKAPAAHMGSWDLASIVALFPPLDCGVYGLGFTVWIYLVCPASFVPQVGQINLLGKLTGIRVYSSVTGSFRIAFPLQVSSYN